MTTCIAAHGVFEMQPRIVLCCDSLAGDEYSHVEGTDKLDQLFAPGLVAMFSGPLDHVSDLRRLCKKHIAKRSLDSDDLKFALQTALAEFREQLELRDCEWPSVDGVVCGFLEKVPSILHIEYHGVRELIAPWACVIGVGSFYADPWIRWRVAHDSLTPFSSNVQDVIYRVYEAKRFSETSKDVGKSTMMAVMRPAGDGFILSYLPHPWIDFLSNQFERFGPQPLPKKREYFRDFPNVISDTSGHSGGDA